MSPYTMVVNIKLKCDYQHWHYLQSHNTEGSIQYIVDAVTESIYFETFIRVELFHTVYNMGCFFGKVWILLLPKKKKILLPKPMNNKTG